MLQVAVNRLKEGACIGIFPEGTIPGEEDIPRWDVEPETGLLRGKTGAVRLALLAGVPIVPVGLTGTGRSFPPEAYPRLQIAPMAKPTPIEVRFGEPIRFRKRTTEDINYDQLRGMTDRVMRAVSLLVDHSKGHVPMTIPFQVKDKPDRIPETPFKNKPVKDKAKVGVLVLHGFTSHVNCVADLRFPLEEMGLPYRIPILRGHGGEWKDLKGVTSKDWYEDAENSLLDLLGECRKAIVVGLSMGGLVALDLAAHHRKDVVGVVTLAAALKFKDPLAPLSPIMARLIRSWPSPNSFVDKELKKQRNRNYSKFATDAFASLYQYSCDVENNLSFVAANALILYAGKDEIVHPKAAETIYEKIGSKSKKKVCIEGSGHEMLLDLEAAAVAKEVTDFIKELTSSVTDEGE
jgi:carboxylesterase